MPGRSRKPSRIYRISEDRYVNIEKDYEMKYGANLYYVWEGVTKQIPSSPLGKFSTFTEALDFVRAMRDPKS